MDLYISWIFATGLRARSRDSMSNLDYADSNSITKRLHRTRRGSWALAGELQRNNACLQKDLQHNANKRIRQDVLGRIHGQESTLCISTTTYSRTSIKAHNDRKGDMFDLSSKGTAGLVQQDSDLVSHIHIHI